MPSLIDIINAKLADNHQKKKKISELQKQINQMYFEKLDFTYLEKNHGPPTVQSIINTLVVIIGVISVISFIAYIPYGFEHHVPELGQYILLMIFVFLMAIPAAMFGFYSLIISPIYYGIMRTCFD